MFWLCIEVDAVDEQVGPAQGGVDISAERLRHDRPPAARDDRDLAMPTLIGVANETTSGTGLHAVNIVHEAAMEPLDPDALGVSVHVALAASRIQFVRQCDAQSRPETAPCLV